MNLKRFFIIILLIYCTNLFSQKAEIKYWTDCCDCTGKFDSTKYTRTQLKNTFDLLWRAPSISTGATIWSMDELNDLSIVKLKEECSAKIKKLESTEFVDDEFWLEVKQKRIKFYELECRLKKYTIWGYLNPDTLMHYDMVDSVCTYYRNALIAGGNKMIDAWIKLNEMNKSRNGNPQRVQEIFEEKLNSSSRYEHARIEIMIFGWWNNANHLLPHDSISLSYEENFKRLLSDVKCVCDEP